jgi:hypothetical protein
VKALIFARATRVEDRRCRPLARLWDCSRVQPIWPSPLTQGGMRAHMDCGTGGDRSNKLQYLLLCATPRPTGGQSCERHSDCSGDHRCAGSVGNCCARDGSRRTTSSHLIRVRPRRRALSWVHATLCLCGILLRVPTGLRRRQHHLLLRTRISRLAVQRTPIRPSSSLIQRGVYTCVRQLEADIRTFIELHNSLPKSFTWTKSADRISASVTRFCHKAQQTSCGEL